MHYYRCLRQINFSSSSSSHPIFCRLRSVFRSAHMLRCYVMLYRVSHSAADLVIAEKPLRVRYSLRSGNPTRLVNKMDFNEGNKI